MAFVSNRRARRVAIGVASTLVFTLFCIVIPTAANADVKIKVLSSEAELVSGGDALLQIEVSPVTPNATPIVTVNNLPVPNNSFNEVSAGAGKWIGKVSGLLTGIANPNQVTVTYGNETNALTLINHPVEGPIISGAKESPFICNTKFVMPPGVPVLQRKQNDGANCGVITRVDYLYRKGGKFIYISNPAGLSKYPDGTATTIVNGVEVPYVVRLETGTINRAIYQSAILHDVLHEPAPTPLTSPAGWNGKLVYPLGGGCEGGWFQQGTTIPTMLNNLSPPVLASTYLSKGYAVTSSTLNVMGQNCSDLLSSETVMMVKERFIENYGLPLFTIGTGGSGGSYQSHQTGDNYPGLFDGIIVSQAFPDVNSSTMFKVFDSRLLKRFFGANTGYSTEHKKAISGFLQVKNIDKSSAEASRIDPVAVFPAGVSSGKGPTFKYHPTTNPGGARATTYDHAKNVYGVVNSYGHAQRAIDNVGVQYGLNALLNKKITVPLFLKLNRNIGGLDRDLKWMAPPTSNGVAPRTVGELGAIERGYKSGRIVWGGNGLAAMPIIDRRDYNDNNTNGDLHNKIHSFSMRERLLAANGHFDNHIILTSTDGGAGVDTLQAMDDWLSAIVADTSESTTLAEKVVIHRPSTLEDGCEINGQFVPETQVASGQTACNAVYPAGTTPRMVAGGPLTDDIVKCKLTPLNRAFYSDYGVTFTNDEWDNQMKVIFPNGVCDWSQPSEGRPPLDEPQSLPSQSFGPSTKNLLYQLPPQ